MQHIQQYEIIVDYSQTFKKNIPLTEQTVAQHAKQLSLQLFNKYYYDYINNPIAEYYFNYHYIINFNNTHFTLNEIFANSSMTSSLPEAELTDLTHDFKFQSALKSDEAQYKPRQQSLQQLTYEQLINQHLRPHQQPQPTHQQPQQVREQAREQQARKQQENNN